MTGKTEKRHEEHARKILKVSFSRKKAQEVKRFKMGSFRRQRTEFAKDDPIHDEATSISFGVYSAQEIRKLSSVEVINPLSFNQLGHPVPGGLYDLKMGPFTDRGDLMCSTCMLHCEHCPGHLGENLLFSTNFPKKTEQFF